MSPDAFDPRAVLSAYLAAPDPGLLLDATLRLGRVLPAFAAGIDPVLTDPIARALVGLEEAPIPDPGLSPMAAMRLCLARMDGGQTVPASRAAALETALKGDPEGWVPAVRIHALADPGRERAARMALSTQELPYLMPGELHPLQVDGLAVADRVVQALHVDWLRKLTEFLAEALILDLRATGLWFWPHLRYLYEGRLDKPLKAVLRARRLPPGAIGLAAAYAARLGLDPAPFVDQAGPTDRLLIAVAWLGDKAG